MAFLTPLFLAAAATALIPVLLHLVRRMRAREVPFSSLMFLAATPIQRIRRRRLQDIMLMLLRAAVLLLLAAVFARPYLLRDDVPFVSEREQESVVILVDASMSMRHAGRFDEAVESAKARLESGNEWAVVAFSRDAEQLTTLGRDRDIHLAALSMLEPAYASTDYFLAITMGVDILEDARYESRTIVLVSDFQQTGFSPAMDDLMLPEGVGFEPVQIGAEPIENRYFSDFAASLHPRGELVAIHLDARVHPEGEVTLNLSGRAVAQQRGPSVSFRQVSDRTGPVLGQLTVSDTETQADDSHYFTYDIQPRPEILVVDPTERQRTAFFLRSAFDLGEASQYGIAVRRAPTQLSGVDLVVVANAAAMSPATVRALTNFAERGGSVVLAFSSGQIPDAGAMMGVGRAESVVSSYDLKSTGAVVSGVDTQHPVFSLFSGGPILRPRFRQFVRVTADSLSTVVASFDTGDPFLIERPVGLGRVLMFTSSLSTEWTDLPLTEVFVPLLYQIAGYATGVSAAAQYTVGDVVSLPGTPGAEWDVSGPGGAVFSVEADSSGVGYFRQTHQPGHYQVRRGRETGFFAVNVDPLEADLAARDAEEAYAAVTYRRAAALRPDRLPEDQEQEQNLWRVLLMIVLGLFVLESIFAARR